MSKEVVFYHLTSSPLEKSLPALLFKIYESGKRVLLVCKSEQQMREMNDILWTFSTKRFIPHGSIEDEHVEMQPVLLATDINELRNKPEITILLSDVNIEDNNNFSKYIYMFYGNDLDSEVTKTKNLYNLYRKLGYNTKYWVLDMSGKWAEMNEL